MYAKLSCGEKSSCEARKIPKNYRNLFSPKNPFDPFPILLERFERVISLCWLSVPQSF